MQKLIIQIQTIHPGHANEFDRLAPCFKQCAGAIQQVQAKGDQVRQEQIAVVIPENSPQSQPAHESHRQNAATPAASLFASICIRRNHQCRESSPADSHYLPAANLHTPPTTAPSDACPSTERCEIQRARAKDPQPANGRASIRTRQASRPEASARGGQSRSEVRAGVDPTSLTVLTRIVNSLGATWSLSATMSFHAESRPAITTGITGGKCMPRGTDCHCEEWHHYPSV